MNDDVKGHQAMNDDVKKVVAWLRRTAGGFPHLETLLAHIDGEPARLAAAREEQAAESDRAFHAALVGDSSYVASLTATPLADEIAALRARVAYLEGELHETIGENADLVVRAERAEAERDALRAQLLSERERLERWLTAPDGKQYERGTVQAVFDECDALRAQVQAAREAAERDMFRDATNALQAERDDYRAQVEAARTYARQSLDYGEDCDAHDLLKAMDEAKP